MSRDSDVFTDLSPRQYLEKFHIEFYLRDALAQFLTKGSGKHGNTNVKADAKLAAAAFFARYFDTVLCGRHVRGRGYRYITQTPHNRKSFVQLMRQGLGGIKDPHHVALTPLDIHDLIVVLCPDFPVALVLEAAEYVDPLELGIDAGEWLCLCGSSVTSSGIDVGEAPLKAFESLRKAVEFFLVFSELVFVLKHIYSNEAEGGLVTRTLLVSEVRRGLSVLPGAAVPSDHQLQNLLNKGPSVDQLPTTVPGYAGALPENIKFKDAVKEMVPIFDVLPVLSSTP